MQVTFHKVAETEIEAASRGSSADEVAHMTGQPENASLVTVLKDRALSGGTTEVSSSYIIFLVCTGDIPQSG